MEIIPWILVIAIAGPALYLALRPRINPYPEALKRLVSDLKAGKGDLAEAGELDPPEVVELRATLGRAVPGKGGVRDGGDPEPADRAIEGLFRYLRNAVLHPLESMTESGVDDPNLHDAVDALRDIEFYARESQGDPARVEVLAAVVLEVTREYTLATGIPVKYHGPPEPLHVRIVSELFKDGLYHLLTNAGYFGGGGSVGVVVEVTGQEIRLRVRDQGPGFSPEALNSAFEPFWTTESDALGLGLTYARRNFEKQGLPLEVGNWEEGGAEAALLLKREPKPATNL